MEDFRDVLQICDPHDISFARLPWTFDNNRGGQQNVKVRLDSAVASPSWSSLFSNATVKHLASPCLDHCPILLQMYKEKGTMKLNKIRHYEIMWEHEESLGQEIEAAWEAAGAKPCLGAVSKALKEVMCSLQQWSHTKFGSIRKELEELRSKLEALQGQGDQSNVMEIKATMNRMNEILYREEMMWLQRSRISWLKEGDRNTKFFHQKAQWRSRKNKIKKLRKGNGEWCDDREEMSALTRDFFRIFSPKMKKLILIH